MAKIKPACKRALGEKCDWALGLPLADISPLGIFVGAKKNADDVNDLPNEEATACEHLQHTADDAPGINAVQTTHGREEDEACEDECHRAGAGRNCG